MVCALGKMTMCVSLGKMTVRARMYVSYIRLSGGGGDNNNKKEENTYEKEADGLKKN